MVGRKLKKSLNLQSLDPFIYEENNNIQLLYQQ